ncbi:PilZ domain-containing protein [Rhodoplanes azumiensis]|uniref:PilZ domain-containing protein n=1 Tax=Rhodoplanes azumiensis TaxID=1897628 RepID=A0ABW5AQ52_9BRAD
MVFFRQQQNKLRELRRSPRFEVHYPAFFDPCDGSTLQSCMICDISSGGAKLTVPNPIDMPSEFLLLFQRRCRIVRRDDRQIGVMFLKG